MMLVLTCVMMSCTCLSLSAFILPALTGCRAAVALHAAFKMVAVEGGGGAAEDGKREGKRNGAGNV